MTAGRVYEGAQAEWDHGGPLARHAFAFMGFSDIRLVRADGMNLAPDQAGARLDLAVAQVRRIAAEWYETEPVTP